MIKCPQCGRNCYSDDVTKFNMCEQCKKFYETDTYTETHLYDFKKLNIGLNKDKEEN